MKKYAQLGSVSHGTMLEEDLIPTFLDLLETLDPAKALEIRGDPQNAPWFVRGDLECGTYLLHEELFDALTEHAPPHCYFGSHPGNSSDYGFWPSEDLIEEFEGLVVTDKSEVPEDTDAEEVLVVDEEGDPLALYQRRGFVEAWRL